MSLVPQIVFLGFLGFSLVAAATEPSGEPLPPSPPGQPADCGDGLRKMLPAAPIFSPGTPIRDMMRTRIDRTETALREQMLPRERADLFRGVLIKTRAWPNLVRELEKATDRFLRHPFLIRGFEKEVGTTALPVAGAAYTDAKFLVSTTPPDPAAENGNRVILSVDFGYHLEMEYRKIGMLNYLVVDPNGKVLEVGGGSDALLEEFKRHLWGRTFSAPELARISEINTRALEFLRANPTAAEKLKAFVNKRGREPGLEEKAGLAYYSDLLTPLEPWAASNGYSMEAMRDAGWFVLNFTRSGKPVYSPNGYNVIRIPYTDNHGNIPVWRTRNLSQSKESSQKYQSWPLNRSIRRTPTVYERLYFGSELPRARGKTIVITEGEFKCLVASRVNGILTVGIPGITEFDETISRALVEADAKEYVVILDRDPRGKALMRVDEITDSERAAYHIARELLRAGAKNVRVGVLPDVFDGGKVGIDDLILAKGTAAFERVVRDAIPHNQYARTIHLNLNFYELSTRRQKIRKALEQYIASTVRGSSPVPPEILRQSQDTLRELDLGVAAFLNQEFRGAYRFNEPTHKQEKLRQVAKVPREDQKLFRTRAGKLISPAKFAQDLIKFTYYPNDIFNRNIISVTNILPYSSRDLRHTFSGGGDSGVLGADYRRGATIAQEATFVPQTFEAFCYVVLAGHLARTFPPDEYRYDFGVAFSVLAKTHWEELGRIPLVVFRRSSGFAVALAQGIFPSQPGHAARERAIKSVRRTSNDTINFLRSFRMQNPIDKRTQIAETLFDGMFERHIDRTVLRAAEFGISAEIVRANRLLLIEPNDWRDLRYLLSSRRLLNQSVQLGLFVFAGGTLEPRFSGPVILMPVYAAGQVEDIRAFHLSLRDGIPPVAMPGSGLVLPVTGLDW